MRPLPVVLLVLVLAPIGSAQAPQVAAEPTRVDWTDHSLNAAHFVLRVRNTGPQPDAFTVQEVRVDPAPGPAFQARISPSPALPLASGASGDILLRLAGWGRPPPEGPPPGTYHVNVTIVSTTTPTANASLALQVVRTHPSEPAPARVEGHVRDARTGLQFSTGGDRFTVTLSQPQATWTPRSGDLATRVAPQGTFALQPAADEYRIHVDGLGFRTWYLPVPLNLTAGVTTELSVSLLPLEFQAADPVPYATVQAAHVGDPLVAAPDLRRLAVPSASGPDARTTTLSLYDSLGSLRWTRSLPSGSPPPGSNAFWFDPRLGLDMVPDASYVVVAAPAGGLHAFDATGGPVWNHTDTTTQNPHLPGPSGRGLQHVNVITFSPDARWVAAGSVTGFVRILNGTTGTPWWTFAAAGQVRALRFAADAEHLWVGTADGRLHALNVSSRTSAWSAVGVQGPDLHLAADADDSLLVLGGEDGTVRVYGRDGAPRWSRTLTGPLLDVASNPTGNQVFVATQAGLHTFDALGRTQWFRPEPRMAGALFVGGFGLFLGYGLHAPGVGDRLAQVVDLSGTPIWSLRTTQPGERGTRVEFMEDGSRLVVGSDRGRAYLFMDWVEARDTNLPEFPTRSPGDGGGSPDVGILAGLATAAGAALVRRARRVR